MGSRGAKPIKANVFITTDGPRVKTKEKEKGQPSKPTVAASVNEVASHLLLDSGATPNALNADFVAEHPDALGRLQIASYALPALCITSYV